jgi:hypothetical protein
MSLTLTERIRRGEAAIDKAKAQGRDVSGWEAHLQALRRQLAEAEKLEPTNDPILSPVQWYPEFHRFHMAVVQETPGFDYSWVRQNRTDLYRSIKAKEDEIDALGAARLSQVMGLLRQWRELILVACFDQQPETRKQNERTK